MGKITPLPLYLLGIFLLGLNVLGILIPLKNTEIYFEDETIFERDTALTPEETFFQLDSLDRNNTKEYVSSANEILSKSIAHYWSDDGLKKYNITIPFRENWILSSLQYIYPSIYKRYEYCGYKKSIERGVGICSQHAITLVDYLRNNGIDSNVVGLNGHVIAIADVGDGWWTFDPDYGIAIPYDIQAIEDNPEIVKKYYEGKLSKNKYFSEDVISKMFEKEDNIIYPSSTLLGTTYGYIDCNWKNVVVERTSYVLIWIIPLLLITPYLKYRNSMKNKKRR